MIKLVVTWSRPADEEGFEAHYRTVHLPLARMLPNALSFETMRMTKGDIYRMAQLGFVDSIDMRTAMSSSQGAALAADANALQEHFGVTSNSFVGAVDEL